MSVEFDHPGNITGPLLAAAERLRAGTLDAAGFRDTRVMYGIYEQRQPGLYSVRVRLTAGRVRATQLKALAELASIHGVRRIHVTTRQGLQLHDVSLQVALQIAVGLTSLGLTSFGSGGKSVRSVVADPLSGLTPDEQFDVHPHAIALSNFLSSSLVCKQLHRKFKIAFSASRQDRAGACAADLGFVAELNQGSRGFRVFVAGGLGAGSLPAIELLPWVEASKVVQVSEAVLSLFTEMGQNANRRKARLRHLRERLGDDEFLRLCRARVAASRAVLLEAIDPDIEPENLPTTASPIAQSWSRLDGIFAQRPAGRYSVRLAPISGDLTPDGLKAIGCAAERFGSAVVRIGIEQELWITGVGGDSVEALNAELGSQGLGTAVERRQLVVACSGAASCRLGVLDARAAASAVEAQLQHCDVPGAREAIRISGCPNACGRHLVAKLGFAGGLTRAGDRQLPSYGVFVGGGLGSNGAKFARRCGAIPAKRLPDFIGALLRAGALAGRSVTDASFETVQSLSDEFARLPAEIPEDWFMDWGKEASKSKGLDGGGIPRESMLK